MNEESTGNFSNPNQAVYHYLNFCDEGAPGTPLIGFEARSPFGAISVGDSIDPAAWNLGANAPVLTVTRMAHKVWQEHDFLCHQTTVYCRAGGGGKL